MIKVMEWLEQDPDLASSVTDTLGLTALHFAALKGDAFLVDCLLYFDPLFTREDIVSSESLICSLEGHHWILLKV